MKFIKLIEKNGMYVTLRLGPFIQAEWTHGYVYFVMLFDSLQIEVKCICDMFHGYGYDETLEDFLIG